MLVKGIVKQTPSQMSLPDGESPIVLDRNGAQMMIELGGKYYTQNYNGNLFIGSSTNAGVVVPADDATAQKFAIWNPAGNNKLLVPVQLRIATTSLGTRLAGGFIFNFLPNAGATIGAAGAPITAWTDTLPICGYIGSGHKPTVRFSVSCTTIAMTAYVGIGIGHELQTTGQNIVMITDFDGTLIIPPNNAFALQMADAASGSTYFVSLSWLELPL